ncbi:MAG: hypothetical protein ACI9V1_003462 [Spirosomataceae bacterium]|jgi:hypothetical protein
MFGSKDHSPKTEIYFFEGFGGGGGGFSIVGT